MITQIQVHYGFVTQQWIVRKTFINVQKLDYNNSKCKEPFAWTNLGSHSTLYTAIRRRELS